MTAVSRMFNKGLVVIIGMTALLFLAGIVLLPGLSSYADEVQAQSDSAGKQAPAVAHNTWTSGAPMPTALWAPGGTAVLKNEIYVVGGCTDSGVTSDTQIYNPATNSWSTGVSLPSAVCDGVAAVVKNVLFLIGGTTDHQGQNVTNAVWAFDPKTKTWSGKSAMPIARDSMGVAVENNIIYVVGGNGSNGNLRLNVVESYDPATDTWTEESPLLVGKSEPSVGRIGTTILAADGFSASGDTGDNEAYNAATNSWSPLQSDPTARNAACVGPIGPRLYVAGGNSDGTTALTESFQPSKNAWKTLAAQPQAVFSAGSAVYKGQLYCFGGEQVQGGPAQNYVQIYQP